MMADPCYVLPCLGKLPEDGIDYEYVVDEIKGFTFLPSYSRGRPGKAITVRTPRGDGVYPVYAIYTRDGHIAEVRIKFLDSDNYADMLHPKARCSGAVGRQELLPQ